MMSYVLIQTKDTPNDFPEYHNIVFLKTRKTENGRKRTNTIVNK